MIDSTERTIKGVVVDLKTSCYLHRLTIKSIRSNLHIFVLQGNVFVPLSFFFKVRMGATGDGASLFFGLWCVILYFMRRVLEENEEKSKAGLSRAFMMFRLYSTLTLLLQGNVREANFHLIY